MCSVKKVFLKISQDWQEITYARVNFVKKETPAEVFSCEFCEIFKNTYFYRTPLAAASENRCVKKAANEKRQKWDNPVRGVKVDKG